MKMRYLGLFALAPLLSQCAPACAPTPPAPVETTTTVTATTTTQVTTTTQPVIPLAVSVSRECSDEHPQFEVTNESTRPIQFAWVDTPNQHAILLAGESMMRPWPVVTGHPVTSFTWTAADPVNNAIFDQGTLHLSDPKGIEDCDSDFSAVIVAAACYTTANGLRFINVGYDTTAPVGYDQVDYTVGPQGGPSTVPTGWVDFLPQHSTHFESVNNINNPVGTTKTVGGTVTFRDDEDVLPDHVAPTNVFSTTGC